MIGKNISERIDKTTLPLHIAAKNAQTDDLLQHLRNGLDIEQRDNGRTPLMWAAQEGHNNVILALIDWGVNINAVSFGGFPPQGVSSLMFAIANLRFDTAELLLSHGANPNVKDSEKSTALSLLVSPIGTNEARLEAGMDFISVLKSYGAIIGIHEAALIGDTESVISLAKGQLSLNTYGVQGLTPLMLAGKGRHIETVQALLDAGADVNFTLPFNGSWKDNAFSVIIASAQLFAMPNKDVEIMSLLISSGFDSSHLSHLQHEMLSNILKNYYEMGYGKAEEIANSLGIIL